MRLQRLTGLEREKIEDEYQALIALIAEYKAILLMRKRFLKLSVKSFLKLKNDLMINEELKLC